eukprot:12671421-Alexandrium_andersonii.AAC.1
MHVLLRCEAFLPTAAPICARDRRSLQPARVGECHVLSQALGPEAMQGVVPAIEAHVGDAHVLVAPVLAKVTRVATNGQGRLQQVSSG